MIRSKQKKLRRGLAGILALAACALFWPALPSAWQMEQATLDFRYLRFNANHSPSERVVVVDIDDHSLRNLSEIYGRWPWPRRVYKEVIEFLAVGEPTAILFDVLFTEATKEGGDDALLADISQAVPAVSHAMVFMTDSSAPGATANLLPSDFRNRFALPLETRRQLPSRHRDFQIPEAAFYSKVHHYHGVTVDLDRDGKLRSVPLLTRFGDDYFPSLALAGVLSTMPGSKLALTEKGIEIAIGNSRKIISLNAAAALPLHFYPLQKSPATTALDAVIDSAAQLQRGEVTDPTQLKVNPFDFKDKVVVIGGSASGLQDLKATPIHQSYPGALAQATAISNILQNHSLSTVSPATAAIVALILITAIYAWLFLIDKLALQIAVPFVLIAVYNAACLVLFRRFDLAMPMAMPNFIAFAALFDGLAYLILVEGGEKRALKSTLSKYVSPLVTEKLINSGMDPRAEVGQHKELTILFSDIRGFTSISEALPPQQIVECLNTYLSQMNEIIFEHFGTVDKFIGDGLMAFWGAPLEDDLHAVHSVRCALGMLKAMESLKGQLKTRFQAPFDLEIGIGVNTGKVIVGNIGSEQHLSYTAIGDNVNLASRIEGITKHYQVPLLIGEATYESVKNHILCRLIDNVQVKGKQQSVKIYQALCAQNDEQSAPCMELKTNFEAAWTAYEVGDFKSAAKAFTAITARYPHDGPAKLYLERIKNLTLNPPESWRGIHVLQSK